MNEMRVKSVSEEDGSVWDNPSEFGRGRGRANRGMVASVCAISLLAIASVAPGQFNPGPNPITGTYTGQQLLPAGPGAIEPTGKITRTHTSSATVNMSGANTVLNNRGIIEQLGTDRALKADGTNLMINNFLNALISAASGDAVRSSTATTSITLTNDGTISVTSGSGGQAVDWNNIIAGANMLTNNGMIRDTGEDAVRPGANGIVMNAGTISAITVSNLGNASSSDGIDTQLNSGVSITNMGSGAISGRHGITGGDALLGLASYAISVTNQAGGMITGINGSGVNIDGVRAAYISTIVNSGTITGRWDAVSTMGDGDGVDTDGTIDLTNNGIIRGLSAMGGGNMPDGVAAGGGTIRNNAGAEITGGALAGIGIEGHAIQIDASNGGNAIAATTVINSGLIRGFTGYGIKMIGTFSNTITNNAGGTIRGAGNLAVGAAIQTGEGNDTITNAGAILGDNSFAIDLQGGDDTLQILGGSASIMGDISGGTGNNMLIIDPGAGNSFTYAGTISDFAADVRSGTVTFGRSETLTSLNIANGSVVILAATAPSTALEPGDAGEAWMAGVDDRGATYARTTPEPGIMCLLAWSVLGLLTRRSRSRQG